MRRLVHQAKDSVRRQLFYGARPLLATNLKALQDSRIESIYVVVAFNVTRLIQEQYASLEKYVAEEFCYFIIDNSTDVQESQHLQRFAEDKGLPYVKLPTNPYTGSNPSGSHGLAINYAVKRWLKGSKVSYVGFIDHDILLYKNFSMLDMLGTQTFYGLRQDRDEKWYLWPGYSFFQWSAVRRRPLNFLPLPGLDTGGGNYPVLYAASDPTKLRFAAEKHVWVGRATSNAQDSLSTIDNTWLHLRNGSGWAGNAQLKKKLDYYQKLKKSPGI